MKYTDIQNEIVQKYNITLNPDSDCWKRTHAHRETRTICKWKQANSIASTFTLFHEAGHITNNTSSMRRAEREFHATVWALERCYEYGIKIPYKTFELYQDYIDRTCDRGIRRGGKSYGNLSLRDALGERFTAVVLPEKIY